MKTLKERQIFVCILATFLVCVLIGCGLYALTYSLSFADTKPVDDESFSFAFPEKIPLRDNESRPVPLPLWQVNEGNGILVQVITGTNLYRSHTKNTGSTWPYALCYPTKNTDLDDVSPRLIDRPNTVFKLANGQPYYYLDIPPPSISA